MNSSQSAALSETIKHSNNITSSWISKYRPDVCVSETQKLNEALGRERESIVRRRQRIERLLEMQQNKGMGETEQSVDASGAFLSQTQRDYRDPRVMSKDIHGNYVNRRVKGASRALNIGANHNNQTFDESFRHMRQLLMSNKDRAYQTHKPIDEAQETLLYEGVSREGEGRRAFLQERGKMMPQERYNEPMTASQEVGWHAVLKNPYTKFDTTNYNRRKYKF